MHVRVDLPEESDVRAHASAHERGELPDRTPYGLHQLAVPGVDVTFRGPLRSTTAAWVAQKFRNRLDGYESIALLMAAASRRKFDAVLCMDERCGFPAALLPGGPPVVSGVTWLHSPEDYTPLQRRVVRRALGGLSAILAQSPGLRDDLIEEWRVDPSLVHRVRVGIDTEFFSVQPWKQGSRTVAGVGDDRLRDHPLLVDAVSQLASRGVDARLEIGTTIPGVVISPGLGVVHRRRMEGEVREMYGRAAVVALALHPTRRGSGSTVVLEAAASARPVVATRTPAMEALIDPSRGLLVEPGDAGAMATAIKALLDDPDRARAMGEAARTWVCARHTSRHMADDIRTVLRRVVPTGGSATIVEGE